MTETLAVFEDLQVAAVDQRGLRRPIVKGVSFAIEPGEVVALIGESGSGKTTIAMSLMGYARPGTAITGGRIIFAGRDIRSLKPRELASLRGREIAYVAQSAAASFNPARTIMAQVVESAAIHGIGSRAEAERKAVALFRELALPDPEHVGARYPHQVSGGQLQRLLAAMALLTGPRLVIFDEPTTALDVTTQIEVLRAFKKVVREHGTTALYVSHDLAVVAQMADRIVVLRDGAVQEIGRTEALIRAPQHPYTASLLAAAEPARAPRPNRWRRRRRCSRSTASRRATAAWARTACRGCRCYTTCPSRFRPAPPSGWSANPAAGSPPSPG